jgi:hypothetical protein
VCRAPAFSFLKRDPHAPALLRNRFWTGMKSNEREKPWQGALERGFSLWGKEIHCELPGLHCLPGFLAFTFKFL